MDTIDAIEDSPLFKSLDRPFQSLDHRPVFDTNRRPDSIERRSIGRLFERTQ
jgi:hypothetical protein